MTWHADCIIIFMGTRGIYDFFLKKTEFFLKNYLNSRKINKNEK